MMVYQKCAIPIGYAYKPPDAYIMHIMVPDHQIACYLLFLNIANFFKKALVQRSFVSKIPKFNHITVPSKKTLGF